MKFPTQPHSGEKMKKIAAFFVLSLLCLFSSDAQDKTPLHLVQTVNVPGVQRKWDHFAIDTKGHRLFVTSEEEPAVEVFDLQSNKHLTSLTEFKEPHNVVVFPDQKQIYVVDGGASEIKILDFDTLKAKGHIALTIDADPIAYDPATKYLYVVNGGRQAKTPYCLVSIVDTVKNTKLADMKLDSPRLESMALENFGKRLFVNMTSINKIGVVDREKRQVVDTWPIAAAKENVPMQYDQAKHRLFVVTRKPSKLVVVNTDNGKEVTSLDVADYVDDLSWDAQNHRLYATGGGGQGAISVVQQNDADNYKVIATIPTKAGAKTGKLSPELNRFYVGVPTKEKEKQEAQILIYEVMP
jgi:DNA-binding beta-propeller fold protein YncE